MLFCHLALSVVPPLSFSSLSDFRRIALPHSSCVICPLRLVAPLPPPRCIERFLLSLASCPRPSPFPCGVLSCRPLLVALLALPGPWLPGSLRGPFLVSLPLPGCFALLSCFFFRFRPSSFVPLFLGPLSALVRVFFIFLGFAAVRLALSGVPLLCPVSVTAGCPPNIFFPFGLRPRVIARRVAHPLRRLDCPFPTLTWSLSLALSRLLALPSAFVNRSGRPSLLFRRFAGLSASSRVLFPPLRAWCLPLLVVVFSFLRPS